MHTAPDYHAHVMVCIIGSSCLKNSQCDKDEGRPCRLHCWMRAQAYRSPTVTTTCQPCMPCIPGISSSPPSASPGLCVSLFMCAPLSTCTCAVSCPNARSRFAPPPFLNGESCAAGENEKASIHEPVDRLLSGYKCF
jgi:hypothetical protein